MDVEGIASLDTAVNMDVDLAYTISNAKLFFPPEKGSSQGDFAPANTGTSHARSTLTFFSRDIDSPRFIPDLSLDATPNVAASASLYSPALLPFGGHG